MKAWCAVSNSLKKNYMTNSVGIEGVRTIAPRPSEDRHETCARIRALGRTNDYFVPSLVRRISTIITVYLDEEHAI